MFRKGGLGRSALISLTLVAIGALLMIELGPANAIGFFPVRVINDTKRTLKIQPCWDLDCLDSIGLATTTIPPHHTPIVGGPKWQWENTGWQQITVAVLKPTDDPLPPFDRCVVSLFPPKTRVGIIRVTERDLQQCPTLGEGGGGGAG
jgi:hypothetical protein